MGSIPEISIGYFEVLFPALNINFVMHIYLSNLLCACFYVYTELVLALIISMVGVMVLVGVNILCGYYYKWDK